MKRRHLKARTFYSVPIVVAIEFPHDFGPRLPAIEDCPRCGGTLINDDGPSCLRCGHDCGEASRIDWARNGRGPIVESDDPQRIQRLRRKQAGNLLRTKSVTAHPSGVAAPDDLSPARRWRASIRSGSDVEPRPLCEESR